MNLEIIFTIGTVIAAASVLVAVISGLRADMRSLREEVRDEMRTMQADIRANAVAIAEIRGMLTHVSPPPVHSPAVE